MHIFLQSQVACSLEILAFWMASYVSCEYAWSYSAPLVRWPDGETSEAMSSFEMILACTGCVYTACAVNCTTQS